MKILWLSVSQSGKKGICYIRYHDIDRVIVQPAGREGEKHEVLVCALGNSYPYQTAETSVKADEMARELMLMISRGLAQD